MEARPALRVTLLLNIQRKRGDITASEQLVRRLADRFWNRRLTLAGDRCVHCRAALHVVLHYKGGKVIPHASRVKQHMAGGSLRKFVFVPGKLANVVVG